MAKPRVFVSSTFYDLRHVRADLERFIRDMGYEPILNERGHIPYGSDNKLEKYAYREVELADILVSIVGGRFGTASADQLHSISQAEFKKAHELGRQIYIFIDRSVQAEHSTYLKNKHLADFTPSAVDNIKVHKFIEELLALPVNNPVAAFETSRDITEYLREQWAGLFQRFLNEQSRLKEYQALSDLKAISSTLGQVVKAITDQQSKTNNGQHTVRDILLINHPAFPQIAKLLRVSFRVFFVDRQEFSALMKSRGYDPVSSDQWDEFNAEEWIKQIKDTQYLLKVKSELFEEDGTIHFVSAADWDPTWIRLETRSVNSEDDGADDIPF